MDILSTVSAFILSVGFALSSLFAPQSQTLSASLPAATAVFETSLAAPISSSATSLTLAENAPRGGGTLSGYACFTIDEGTSQAEFVCGTVSGTSVTSLSRGISPSTGTTTVASLQFSHRRGASVKITDFPLIQIIKAQANGQDTFPNILKYASHPTFTATTDIVDKKYVDDTAFSGASVIDATASARGVVELSTGAEAAASTASGSSGPLALPASIATSTFNSATAANVIPVTGGTGQIASMFVATSSLYTAAAGGGLASTTYVGSFPAYQIGKNRQVFTSTGTTTFAVPSGISKVYVEVIGGGGTGGNANANGESGTGGGAGGYANEVVDVSATTSIQVYVAPAGAWSTFGTNGFYLYANPGGTGNDPSSSTAGGIGGCGSGGDVNTCGGAGANGGTTLGVGAGGGSVFFGGGVAGRSGDGDGTACSVGTNGSYGGGGQGGISTGAARSGGAGCQGLVIVRW